MGEKVIIVTGSRNWPADRQDVIERILLREVKRLSSKGEVVIRVGDAGGVDLFAASIATGYNITLEYFVADWPTYGRAAGSIRNRQMTSKGAAICLAFKWQKVSIGTEDCMDAAMENRIPINLVYFDNEVLMEEYIDQEQLPF